MMMGLVMIGAIATNASPVGLDQTTPISRLTAEFEVIVVPADSEYQTLDDLIAAFQADPTSISWGGGSAGGTDHILVGLIAQAVGVDPTQVNYVPFSGGGEALAAILGGQVSAGVSGVGEWLDQIESGELRALAVSGTAAAGDATPQAGGATPAAGDAAVGVAPTLQEQGIDVELANWRGVVAPPEISEEGRQCLAALVEQMVASDGWAQTREQYGWQDFALSGDEFATFLTEERERVIGILTELGLVTG
jgi:putative tricarboxylic transport membrane protein